MQETVSVIIKAVNEATQPMQEVAKSMKEATRPAIELRKRLAEVCKIGGFKGLVSDLKKVKHEIAGVAKEAKALMGKGLLVGGGLLAGAAYGAKNLFIDVAAEQERYVSMLTTLTGSLEKAKESMSWIQNFAQKTPYELADVTQAFIKLKAYGIDPQSGALELMGDAAAAMGKPLEQAIEALGDAKGGEFERLKGMNLISRFEEINGKKVAYYTDKDGKERAAAADKKDPAALQNLVKKIITDKGLAGGMNKLSQTWDGKVLAMIDSWQAFRRKIMDSGPFEELQKLMDDMLQKVNELFDSGEIDAIAEEWGKNIVSGIKSAKAWLEDVAIPWFKEDFWPTFVEIKNFFGGWGETIAVAIAVVAAVIMGPLISAVVSLGIAIMSTPVGWILAIIAAIGAAVYLLIKHWDKIVVAIKKWCPLIYILGKVVKEVFSFIWGFIKEKLEAVYNAFQVSWVDGIVEIFKNFTPMGWIMQGWEALVKFLFGIDLFEAGTSIVKGILDGMGNAWDGLIKWFKQKVGELTGVLPDWAKSGLAFIGGGVGNAIGSMLSEEGRPETGAGKMLESGKTSPGAGFSAAFNKFSANLEQTVKTEVVIKAENLPPGMAVTTPKSEADRTKLDLGYAMQGAGA